MKKIINCILVFTAILTVGIMLNACGDDEVDSTSDSTEDNADKTEEQLSKTGTINGHSYVDLGLSVKWATCNVGTDNPEEKGSFFAWAEIEEKDSYSMETYSFRDPATGKIRDIEYENISGTKYDAARVQWGGSWRMPTRAEFVELFSNCSSQDFKYKGVSGMLFTASNGNCVFLPLSGEKYNGDKYGGEYKGSYWTSEGNTHSAHPFCITYSVNQTGVYSSWNGLVIRPVSD